MVRSTLSSCARHYCRARVQARCNVIVCVWWGQGLQADRHHFAGGKILLNKARLHLKRGRRYGLCGHNGAGKVSV